MFYFGDLFDSIHPKRPLVISVRVWGLMEYRAASLRLDVGKLDDLAPLLDVVIDNLGEVGS
jgi:hypothetical protein